MISIFFSGLLLMGIGSGVAFAEFSSFHYGGEKILNGEMTPITLEQKIPEQAETIQFFVNRYGSQMIRFETDSTLEEDQVSVVVYCNQESVSPYIREQEKLNREEDEALEGENIDLEGAPVEQAEETANQTEKLANQPGETAEFVYFIDFRYLNSYDEVSQFFKIKEEFLEGIKKRVVYSYSYDDIGEVVIKASPELMDRIAKD